jgi:hypothetical protein
MPERGFWGFESLSWSKLSVTIHLPFVYHPDVPEHDHTISCLEEVEGQLVCKVDALRRPMTESEADARAKSLWGNRGFAIERAPGLFRVGYYRTGQLGGNLSTTKGEGKTFEEAFASSGAEGTERLRKTSAKVSVEQAEVLRRLGAGSGRLIRIHGGFWSTPETPMKPDRKEKVPQWWTSVQTIRAMERKGWLARAGKLPEEWKDDRVLTDAGKALAAI